jgi:pimeloyl-ACP methyl ester carboxylesterase
MKKLMFSSLLVMLVLFCLAGCSKGDNPNASKTFVLVHGAWQAPYVWDVVKSELEAKGQKVIVVELPAHGSDMTSPAAVSIDVYRDKVIAAVQSVNGKVILVGHSMGGVVVTAVAEKIPSKIEKLVYIGAFLPANGQSLMDLALTDAQSILGPNLIPSKDQLTLDVNHDKIIDIFCQDANADIQKEVLAKFRVEPAIPFGNKVSLTDANFGSVMKYYIHTAQDHAVGIDLQNRMVTAAHITKTYSLDTGHSPFLTKPDQVTAVLLAIINN